MQVKLSCLHCFYGGSSIWRGPEFYLHTVLCVIVTFSWKLRYIRLCPKKMSWKLFCGRRNICWIAWLLLPHTCLRKHLDEPSSCLWRAFPVSEPQVCGGVQHEASWGYEWNHLAHAWRCSSAHGPEGFQHGENWLYAPDGFFGFLSFFLSGLLREKEVIFAHVLL